MKKRNPLLVVLFTIISFGIYSLYWFYKTSCEMKELTKKDFSAGLWTFSLFIPIWNIITLWKYGKLVEESTNKEMGHTNAFLLMLLIWIIGMPIIQSKLNKLSESSHQAPAEAEKPSEPVQAVQTLEAQQEPEKEEPELY